MKGLILAALISTAGFYHCEDNKGAVQCRPAQTPVALPPATPDPVDGAAQTATPCAVQPVDASAVPNDPQTEAHAQCVRTYRHRQYDAMNETWHLDRIRACDELNARRQPSLMQPSPMQASQPQTEAPQLQLETSRSVAARK